MLEVNQELSKIISEIDKHNKEILNNKDEKGKIDFSKTKQNWGTKVIPKKFHLKEDTYQTINGYKVIIDGVKLMSNGKEMTYPLKGRIYLPQPKGKDKIVNSIWTLDGRNNVIVKNYNFDLVNIEII